MIKRLLAIILVVIISSFCTSCDYSTDRTNSIEQIPSYIESSSDVTSSVINSNLTEIPSNASSSNSSSNNNEQTEVIRDLKMKAVWIEYTDNLFNKVDETEFIKRAAERFENIKKSGFNTVILHTRSNADAIYPSSYFPFAKSLTGIQGQDPGFDPLEIAIELAHKEGLEIHAWINPYRISALSSDINTLSDNHIAKIWKKNTEKGTDSYVIPWDNKLFFNPSCNEVQKLIINGVQEILDNYDVDGIHFDDYFYPDSDANFDIGSYAAYCRNTKFPLSQGDWRRNNVDTLVAAVYRIVNEKGKVFGISPAAPISQDNSDRNYNEYYINVKKWMANKGYINYIAPQLYFGYEHKLESTRFDKLLSAWTSAKRIDDIELYIGLAAYKIGLDNNADLDEWATEIDILKREYIDCTKVDTDGIIIYNYSAFFSDNELNKQQRENLINIMNGE